MLDIKLTDDITTVEITALLNNLPFFYKGDYHTVKKIIDDYNLKDVKFNYITKHSKSKLLDITNCNSRIEPGAIIRENVILKDNSIVLMGAVLNVGCVIGASSMIDMNAVIGSGAYIGNNCHIGAGAVVSGVLEPISKNHVIIEDDVFIGANSVILEGIKVGKGAIVGACSIVTKDVLPYTVVFGNPARFIRYVEEDKNIKTKLNDQLR